MADLESIDTVNPPAGALGSGMIVIWAGTIANIPAGFVICDGNNSTPNLLSRFVQEVPTAITDPGGTGGATSQSVSSHRHNTSNHQHYKAAAGANVGTKVGASTLATTISANGHTHPYGTYTDTDGAAWSGYNTASVTDGRPKFYAVAYLMKT